MWSIVISLFSGKLIQSLPISFAIFERSFPKYSANKIAAFGLMLYFLSFKYPFIQSGILLSYNFLDSNSTAFFAIAFDRVERASNFLYLKQNTKILAGCGLSK